MTKKEFDTKYKQLADKYLLPFLIEQHKKTEPNDTYIHSVESDEVSREELLKHYYSYYYYKYSYYYYKYYYNYYNYYNNNYYYDYHNIDFVEFMKIINKILAEIFSE